MKASATLPSNQQLVETLSTLLDVNIDIRPASSTSSVDVVATYVDDGEQIVAMCTLDAAAAATLGAAFTRIPPQAAKECATEKNFDGGIKDNIKEILNVASQFFRDPRGRRMSLQAVYLPGETIPSDVRDSLEHPFERSDVEVDIVSYLTGRLSLLVITPKSA